MIFHTSPASAIKSGSTRSTTALRDGSAAVFVARWSACNVASSSARSAMNCTLRASLISRRPYCRVERIIGFNLRGQYMGRPRSRWLTLCYVLVNDVNLLEGPTFLGPNRADGAPTRSISAIRVRMSTPSLRRPAETKLSARLNRDDHFSSRVPVTQMSNRGGDLGKGVTPVDHRRHLGRLDQLRHDDQVAHVDRRDEEDHALAYEASRYEHVEDVR